jgi:hypothetical protein
MTAGLDDKIRLIQAKEIVSAHGTGDNGGGAR